jgi:hypothetical protein
MKGYGWVGEVTFGILKNYFGSLQWAASFLGFVADVAAWSQHASRIQSYLGAQIKYRSQYHPAKQDVYDAIADPDTVFYLADGHGDSEVATVRETGGVDGGPVELKVIPNLHNPEYRPGAPEGPDNMPGAMDKRGQMKFALMTHCGAMDEMGYGTWAHAFSKGQETGTVVIGVTDGVQWASGDWVSLRMHWLPTFFQHAFAAGEGPLMDPDRVGTFKEAFDEACRATWGRVNNEHLRFYGDANMTFLDLY